MLSSPMNGHAIAAWMLKHPSQLLLREGCFFDKLRLCRFSRAVSSMAVKFMPKQGKAEKKLDKSLTKGWMEHNSKISNSKLS